MTTVLTKEQFLRLTKAGESMAEVRSKHIKQFDKRTLCFECNFICKVDHENQHCEKCGELLSYWKIQQAIDSLILMSDLISYKQQALLGGLVDDIVESRKRLTFNINIPGIADEEINRRIRKAVDEFIQEMNR